jgi:hypothetical protein
MGLNYFLSLLQLVNFELFLSSVNLDLNIGNNYDVGVYTVDTVNDNGVDVVLLGLSTITT